MAIGTEKVGALAAGATNSATPSYPGTVADGDTVLAWVGARNNPTSVSAAGWTQVGTAISGTDIRGALFIKDVPWASGATTPTFTSTGGTAGGTYATLIAIPGVDTTTELDVAVQTATGNSTTMTAPSATPVTNGARVLQFFCHSDDANHSGNTNSTTLIFGGASYVSATGGDGAMSCAAKTIATASTPSGTTNMTQAAGGARNTYVALTVALRPAPTVTPIAASDSITITESVAIGVSATDSLTITDAARVGIPIVGTESVTVTESVTIAGSLGVTDPVTITDTIGIVGHLSAADSLTITDVPKVGPKGTDTLAITDQVSSLVGHLGVVDPITISDGAAIETLFGDLVIALFAVHPTTGALVALPDHKTLTMSRERNSAGTISLTYPVDSETFHILRDTITADRDLEVEIWTIGSKTGALRGFLQEADGDDVVEDRTWTFAGAFGEILLNEAIAWPAPIITITTVVTTTKIDETHYTIVTKTTTRSSAGGPAVTTTVTTSASTGTEGTTTTSQATKGDLEFEAVTPGAFANFLLDQAQGRGGLTGMTRGFTATHDSNGIPWPNLITSKFSPGSTYDSMLARLVDFGVAEWGVTWTGSAYRLDLWVIFGRGFDRSVGARPIVLRKARNLIDAPRKWTVRSAGTTVLATGAEGVYESASDADALARRGRRIERSASAANLTDADAVQGFAQNQLHLIAVGQLEISHGIAFLPGEPRPVISFDIGDWIYSETSVGLERLRVVQWTLSVDADQGASGTVTLNDTITDALSRLQALLDNLTSGDTVVGTSTSSGSQDNSTPLPPEVLSAASVAFLDGTLGVRAAVTVAWDPPVLNTDGTVITDMDHFNVMFALATSPDVWNAGITAGANESDATFVAPAGQTITIRVNAVDHQGNTSVWSDPPYPHTTSDDDIPPPIPSAAVVSEFLGTVRINWDGLTTDGAVMYEAAIDFDVLEVHLSTASLFTPDNTTLVGSITGKGTWTVTDLTYDVTQYARFVAVDWSGNRSDPSAQGSATPVQILSPDVFDGAIGTSKLADLAVINAKIANATILDAKIANLSVGKLTAGTLSADVILGSFIRTALTGNRVEISSGGIQLFNGSNIVVDFKVSNGSALVVGEFRTSLTGQRIVFNPGGALADTMNFYPSAAGDFARIMARTAPADGSAAILIDGGAANGTSRGRLGAYKGEAFVSYVTGDAGGDTSAGFSTSAVSTSLNAISIWTRGQINIWKVNTSNDVVTGTQSGFFWAAAGGAPGGVAPCLTGPHNSGIKMDLNGLIACSGNGAGYVPIYASGYPGTSSRTIKTDEASLAVDPEQVLRELESKQWRYIFEVDTDPDAPLHYGPIAEDAAAVEPSLVTMAMGTPAIDVRDLTGVLWAALRKTIARVDALESGLS